MILLPDFFDESDSVDITSPWFIKLRDGNLILYVDNEEWILKQRIESHKIEAIQSKGGRPRILLLNGAFNAAEMILSGIDVEITSLFARGIPENWKDKVQSLLPPPPPPLSIQKNDISVSTNNEENMENPKSGEKKRRRSKRNKEQKISYDEDDLFLKALREAEAKTFLEIIGEDKNSDVEEKEEEVLQWTANEISSYRRALLELSSSSSNLWDKVSNEYVITKSANECRERWLRETVGNEKTKDIEANHTEARSEEEAMKRVQKAAKLGTAKFRKQVRLDWERENLKKRKRQDDLATPFKNQGFNILPRSCCKDIVTPVSTFQFGEEVKKQSRPINVIFEDDILESPEVLREMNLDNWDGYVLGLKKRYNQKGKRFKKAVTPMTRAGFNNVHLQASFDDDGVQATLTPGGTVKLIRERMNDDDNEEEKQRDSSDDEVEEFDF